MPVEQPRRKLRLRLPELHRGTLLRRYKRFLADVRLDTGEELTAHCANPGRMTACMVEGGTIWLSHNPSPRRKLKWSWELSEMDGAWILVNTARPNAIVGERLSQLLPGRGELKSEVKVGASRLDFRIGDTTYVEVKSVTLQREGVGAFPDAPTARGRRHLSELSELSQAGHEAILFWAVARDDVHAVRPADEIDPEYGKALRQAVDQGVRVMAHRMVFGGSPPHDVRIGEALPILLD